MIEYVFYNSPISSYTEIIKKKNASKIVMPWLNKRFFSRIFSDTQVKIERVSLFDLRSWLELQFIAAVQKSNFNETLSDYSRKAEDLSLVLGKRSEEYGLKLIPEKKEEYSGLFLEIESLIGLIKKLKEKDPRSIVSYNNELKVIVEKIISHIEEKIPADSPDEENVLRSEMIKIRLLQGEFSLQISQAGLERINHLFLLLEKIYGYTENILRVEEVLKRYNSKLSVAEARRNEKEARLSLLAENADFIYITDIIRKKNHLLSRIKKNNQEVVDFFLKLNLALKRYHLAYPGSLLEDYFNNPVLALQRDESLSLLHIFDHFKAVVSENKLNISPEEKERVKELIDFDLAEYSYLEKLHRKDFRLRQALSKLEESNLNKELLANLEEVEYRRKHFTEIVDDLSEKIQALEEDIHLFKEKRSKEKISFQNIVKEVLKKEIIINIFDINPDEANETDSNEEEFSSGIS